MTERLRHLKNCLAKIPQAAYPQHSRIHLLRSFHFPSASCYVKRDDELGFGISGSKIRKYRTLIPFFIHQGIQEVVVIGSAYSNHVLSLQQLLIENGIRSTLFLRGDRTRPLQGNLLLTSLFTSPSAIHWFSKATWQTVESQAHAYAQEQQHPTFVLPEGGFCAAALPGALTLTLDLQDNVKAMELNIDHIFIEAGTGLTAGALILGLHWLKHPATVHVFLLAEDTAAFVSRLKACHEMFMQLICTSCPFPQNFALHLPQLTGRFGQIHSRLFGSIAEIARKEGFLTDPIYTAKLFMESKHLLAKENIKGNILIHHSGGALSLFGFQEQLQPWMEENPFSK